MPYNDKAFCWHGLHSTDPERAKAFYPEVLGWTTQEVDMGGNMVTMFAANGVPRGHVTQAVDTPSHWTSYLRVENVDAATKAVRANGGTVLVPPTDIPPGRFSTVTTPSGAAFNLFHEADPKAENAPPGNGSIHWNELWSKDLDADVTFLKAAFGFETEVMPMPDGPYTILKTGDRMSGGAMASQNEKAPAMWLVWVQSDDVDATVARAGKHGGQVIAPAFDVPNVGRMAILADPAGGVFGAITPAPH